MISRFLFAAALLLTAGDALALGPGGASGDPPIVTAQLFNRPAGEADSPAEPESGPDTAALMSRIDRLERDQRRLTGQNEELQHKVQLLEEQLKAARDASAARPADVAAHPAAPVTAASPTAAAPATGAPVVAPVAPAGAGRRSDAFDPSSDPNAPGAPRPLGTASPSAPIATTPRGAAGSVTTAPAREAGQPLDIAHGRLVGDAPAPVAEIAAAPDVAPTGLKDEYDEALATLKAGKFEAAEKSLTSFLTKNPKSKYAPAATFNLGESFFLRGRHREAAEKYLEISQKFGQSAQAPDALLRLGQSLGAMGAKDQACASFGEIGVKYPGAAVRVREAAERESKKLQC